MPPCFKPLVFYTLLHACGSEALGVVQGLQIEDSELREYTHGMLGSIADKLGKEFAPFLPHAVEAAFASCSQASTHCPILLMSPVPKACSQRRVKVCTCTAQSYM